LWRSRDVLGEERESVLLGALKLSCGQVWL
jgi:hypothetical protein